MAFCICFPEKRCWGGLFKHFLWKQKKGPIAAQCFFSPTHPHPRVREKAPPAACGTQWVAAAEMPRYCGPGEGLGSATREQVSWRVQWWWWPMR